MPTYANQEIMLLNFDSYFEIIENKGLKIIRMRRTQTFEKTRGLEITISNEHIWSFVDNYRKLSNEYYGTPIYWWVLAFVNKKPTDAHMNIGDEVLIPDAPTLITGALRE